MLKIILAFVIDFFVGDPAYPLHPARLMGRAITWGEDYLRAKVEDERQAGAILAVAIPAAVFLITYVIIEGLKSIHPAFSFAAGVFGIYSAISVRDLYREGEAVLHQVQRGDLPAGRTQVARIVGRDTENLDEKEVLRAAVEAVSESTVDGIIAPLFFAALGGAPLALAYKAVNTLDSMIGHQNERYKDFGFVAAKMDEVWNWVPARLSFFLTCAAAYFKEKRHKEAWQAGLPHVLTIRGNSAVPEASFAGALGVQLGGPSSYQGRVVDKPFLGTPERELNTVTLHRCLDLMLLVSWFALGAAVLIWILVKL